MFKNSPVNNSFYGDLGDRWYLAQDDPVALLRAENRAKLAWIQKRLPDASTHPLKILDVGCGAGFCTNALASLGHQVTGVDLAEGALKTAKKYDTTGQVQYRTADALDLPFEDESFDCVVCLDFLEHVEDPRQVISEISRVLRPGGQFFYHTFSRNWLAYFIVILGVSWFVKNTPKDLHVYHLFLDQKEVAGWMKEFGILTQDLTGLRPKLNRAFLKLLGTRQVPPDFEFTLTSSVLISYLGDGVKVAK